MLIWRYRYSVLYLIMIPLVNWAFGRTPHYTLPDGNAWYPFSIVVGLVLVVRDFAQREIGSYIFIPLCIGIVISYFMAPPAIALASAGAFAVSEVIDWAIFTFTRAAFSVRVIASSIIGSIADSLIFLSAAETAYHGIFSVWTLSTMLLSKFSGILLVFILLRRREKLRLQKVAV